MKTLSLLVKACLLSTAIPFAFAQPGSQSPLSDADLLAQRINAAGGLPQARAQAADPGRRLAEECALCHGVDGNKSEPSLGLEVPNLAQQQPLYLLKQLRSFAAKQRMQPTMHHIASRLSDDDRVTLALYFSGNPLTPYPGEKPRASNEEGLQIYQRLCIHCHGDRADGLAAIPRLRGQNPNYVVTNLIRFRDKRPTRTHAGMSLITREMKTDDMKAIATYLVSIPGVTPLENPPAAR